MLQHEPEEVDIVVHLKQKLDGFLLLAPFKSLDDLLPLLDEHQVGVGRLDLFLGLFQGERVAGDGFGLLLDLGVLEVFEVG